MKRFTAKIMTAFLLFFMLFAVAGAGQAFDYGRKVAADKAKYDTSGRTDVYSMVHTIVNAALALFAFVFFFLILFGGVRWLTARGNDEFVTRAKGYIESAIWGLIITLGAYGITSFVFSRLNQ